MLIDFDVSIWYIRGNKDAINNNIPFSNLNKKFMDKKYTDEDFKQILKDFEDKNCITGEDIKNNPSMIKEGRL
jgi:hypothetical protein